MMPKFLYSTRGEAVAFRRVADDPYLWDVHGRWIGWFPWGDADAVDRDGKYLGTMLGDRLLSRVGQSYRGYPGYPGYPGYAGYPGYPGRLPYSYAPWDFRDVDPKRLTS
jgi:hypothetical protein